MMMVYYVCVCLMSIVIMPHAEGQSLDVPGYFRWIPPGSSRTDLYCPEYCRPNNVVDNRGCSCNALPCWEMNPPPSHCNVTFGRALIEYIGIAGTARIQVHPNDTNATYLRLEHESGKLTSLPENICSFPNLKYIYVQHNKVESIRNISCLNELEVLDLGYNKLTSVPNTTFSALRKLRILKLNNNAIKTLGPNTLQKSDGEIFTVDLSQNHLHELDITNIVRAAPFCLRNVSNSSTDTITNGLNFTIDKTQIYGPGDVDCTNALVATLVNVTEYDLPMQDISQYMQGRWIIGGDYSYDCNCNIARMIQSAGTAFFKSYWVNSYNFTCATPDTLKGQTLGFVVDNDMMDDMTCDLHEYCPDKCTCTDIQTLDKVVVNCTNAGFTHFPDYMPVGGWNNRDLDLILDGNSITRLEDREYLNRVTSLSLAGNAISSLDANAQDKLPDNTVIDISTSTVRDLPAVLQRRNPNMIKFGSVPVDCDCTNTWISVWVRNYGAFNKLKCNINGNIVKAESATLDCSVTEGMSLGMVLTIVFATLSCLILVTLSIYCLRYEIFILKRRIGRLRKKKIYKASSNLDLFVSFDEDDESPSVNQGTHRLNLCDWTMSVLKPRLNHEGFSSFVPFADMQLGTDDNKYDQTIQAISDSSIYLILYTSSYSRRNETISQFKYIWEAFRKYPFKTIIVINFDGTPTSFVGCRKMRALMRAGNPLDYSVTNKRMIDRLVERLEKVPKATIDVNIEDTYTEQEDDDSLHEREADDDSGFFNEGTETSDASVKPEPDNDDTLSVVRTDVNAEENETVHIPNAVVPNGAGRSNTNISWINVGKRPTKARKKPEKHQEDNCAEDDEAHVKGDIDIQTELEKIHRRERSQKSDEHWKMYDITKYAYSTARHNGTNKRF